MDDRRLLFDGQKFKKRMEALNKRIAALEKEGELTAPLDFLARDAAIAWASGESSENWEMRSAVTDASLDRLKEKNVWPWEFDDTAA